MVYSDVVDAHIEYEFMEERVETIMRANAYRTFW